MERDERELERKAEDAARSFGWLFTQCDKNEFDICHQWNLTTRRCTYCDKPMDPN